MRLRGICGMSFGATTNKILSGAGVSGNDGILIVYFKDSRE